MASFKIVCAIAALALLPACEAKIGEEAGKGGAGAQGAAAQTSAEGKAEEGRFSIKGPGFDMKVNIPKGMADNANVEGDNDLLYPGSTLSGMHIEASSDASKNKANSGVELRFTSSDAPDKVAAWYRDPARADGFTLRSAVREGAGYLISGTAKDDGDPFTLRLGPMSGGGTNGRLTLANRS